MFSAYDSHGHLIETSGDKREEFDSLSTLNDDLGWSFEAIAEAIEANL